MKRTALVLGCLLLLGSAKATRADSFSTPVWDYTGVATITGNNNCNGPCVEDVHFSFDLSYDEVPVPFDPSSFPNTFILEAHVTDFSEHWSGVLGSFSFSGPSGLGCCTGGAFIELQNALHDEIDISVPDLTSLPTTPPIIGAFLFSCGQPTPDLVCLQDFSGPNGFGFLNGT